MSWDEADEYPEEVYLVKGPLGQKVGKPFKTQREAVAFAKDHIRRTGEFYSVEMGGGNHHGEVAWQAWHNEASKQRLAAELGVKLK